MVHELTAIIVAEYFDPTSGVIAVERGQLNDHWARVGAL
jgi:hypothetical protein